MDKEIAPVVFVFQSLCFIAGAGARARAYISFHFNVLCHKMFLEF